MSFQGWKYPKEYLLCYKRIPFMIFQGWKSPKEYIYHATLKH